MKEFLMREAVIRKAVKGDLEAVYEIESLSFKDPYPHTFLGALHSMNPKTFLVAERNGKPIGYVIASEDRGQGHILAIAVHPSERRKGVGKSLIVESLKALRGLGVTLVRLEVRRSNAGAQSFYKESGFTYSHILEKYYDDEDAFIYYNNLQ